MSEVQRPAFDAIDARRAEDYLGGRGFTMIDPFTAARADQDIILKASLSGCRFVMEQSFGTRRADGSAFRAYPLILGRPSANAFAVEDAGLQLCGLDLGLVTACFEMSLFTFSQAALFTEIGAAEDERSPALPDGLQLAFSISDRLRARGETDGTPIGAELLPLDPQRQDAAQFLTQLLLRFVWLHEFYHCLNGHTGLVAAERPGAVLNEMADDSAIGLIELASDEEARKYQRLRHAMEYDADRSALWMLVRLQQNGLEPVPRLASWPEPLRLKLAIFAAAMMTFLFDQTAKRQAWQPGSTHPQARHRLIDLVRTLASNLAEPSGGVKAAFNQALAELTALERCLPQFGMASRLLSDVNMAPLQKELNEIDDGLTAAREKFAPYAYRAPPGQAGPA